ncbi:MAG: NYN domain-containing protein [Phycisphaerae bacterium]|nr:NYN domain-containing protein [Phycisphaerae bacterium]
MSRISFFIDGFNMYHALQEKPTGCPTAKYQKYKWLNYRKLAELVVGAQDDIERIVYFTAYATWKSDSVKRHKNYIKVLRSAGIEIVWGKFKRRDKKCHLCGGTFLTHEEKRTDVNIALGIVSDAVEDRFDKAILISADSDLLPVVQTVHRLAPDKEVGVMFPIGRSSEDLRRNADFLRKMPESLLQASQFPNEVVVGTSTIKRPSNWPK